MLSEQSVIYLRVKSKMSGKTLTCTYRELLVTISIIKPKSKMISKHEKKLLKFSKGKGPLRLKWKITEISFWKELMCKNLLRLRLQGLQTGTAW
jgi:hypothetical protein